MPPLLTVSGASTARRVPTTRRSPLYQEALGIKKSDLGEEHVGGADSLDGLAHLCRAKGAYDKADRPPSRLPEWQL